jgi:hypothetical protein
MMSDHRRAFIVVAATVAAMGGCRSSRAPESAAADSAQPSARSDSAPPGAAGATARADSVVLRTDKTQYKAGDQMTLTLENRSASSYAFNPCTRSIEREESGAWTAVPEPGRMCTMEAWILDAHGTRSGPTELPSPLAPGRYRVVVRLTVESPQNPPGSAVSAVSEPITVT